MFRNEIILGIIVLFVSASVTPIISGNIEKNSYEDNKLEVIKGPIQTINMEIGSSGNTDWWPMFHHDLQHSGYSTSDAPDTNNTIWSYTTGDYVCSSPAVANGRVYVGSNDDKVYCLDVDTGGFIWNYTTGGGILSSPVV